MQVRCDCSSVSVLVISPPQEGNCRLRLGELEGASGCTPPRQAELDIPPEEGNWPYGLGNLVGTDDTTPSGLRLPPLQRRGIALPIS